METLVAAALLEAQARAVLETVSSDPLTWLVNLGTAGVWLICLATGLMRTKGEVDHLLAEIAAKDKVIDAVHTQLLGQTLPALARSTRVIEAVPASEAALVEQLRQTQAQANDLIRRMERLAHDDRGTGEHRADAER